MALPGKLSGNARATRQRLKLRRKLRPDEIFDLKITVGPHPNTVEHSIRWIMVTLEESGRPFNPVLLGKVSFTPVTTQPEVVMKVKLLKGGVIHAVEYCNLHGFWAGKKEIIVQ